MNEKEKSVVTLTKAQIALKDFRFVSVTDEEIEDFIKMYSGLKITGEGKKRTESYELVKKKHIKIKAIYSEVEKERKGYASTASQIGKQINSEAARLKELLKPLGEELKATRDAEEKIKSDAKEAKAKIDRDRIQKIKIKIEQFEKFCNESAYDINVDSGTMEKALEEIKGFSVDESFFEEFTPEISMKKESFVEKLSGMVIKKVEYEKEKERLKADKETQRLAAEKLAKEKADFEAEQKIISDKMAMDKKTLEAEKAEQSELIRLENEALQKEKDKIESEKIRVMKEEEEKKKLEKEELLKPDKEKLLQFIDSFKFQKIDLQNEEAMELFTNFNIDYEILLLDYKQKIQEEL